MSKFALNTALVVLAFTTVFGGILVLLGGIHFSWGRISRGRFLLVLGIGFTALGLASKLAAATLNAGTPLSVLVPLTTTLTGIGLLLELTISINVALAIFNLIPVPPLDGSRVVDGLIPARLRPQWENFSRFAPFLLLGVMIFGGVLISGPSRVAHEWLNSLLRFIVTI